MAKYGELVQASFGERPPTIRKVDTVEEVLQQADVPMLASTTLCPCLQVLQILSSKLHPLRKVRHRWRL